ncbi:DUF3024 domain-containing protein [Vibrio sagamiensis]|uniref:DUF3024 domain-containing protein n=1 Tax=Vibrio sagamiensis NBRC 104589 TaxID=1219064 RepID=A0A511QCU6_9VIBR|nr:DUF3024 domain-containing protein [Vibrio sagamiensis]PNQ66699.1 DUF3024 domain-containing protein [Vibrio agarivorans]GEM75113.1 hypothetical protein VSA01S_12250 [Vibrio sagamiensis NBRC 104589]
MSVSQMAIGRLYKSIELLCGQRNANVSVELGKCLYEPLENGIELYQAHFLLDSQHSEYTSPVAKVSFDAKSQLWELYIPKSGEEDLIWIPYETLSTSSNLETILAELESDPLACFWS